MRPAWDPALKKRAAALLVLVALLAGSGAYFALSGREESAPVPMESPAAAIPPADETPEPPEQEKQLSEIIDESVLAALDAVEKQARVDEMLLKELRGGSYTFDEPFVMLDPYQAAPLSAILLFRTEEPVKVSVHIPGDNALSDVDYTFEAFETEHQIPIYGLYANRSNPVTVTAEGKDGGVRHKQIDIKTGGLPSYFDAVYLIPKMFDEAKYEPGFNFSWHSLDFIAYRFAFDCDANVRWLLSDETIHSTPTDYQTPDGNYMIAIGSYWEGRVLFEKVNGLGKILGLYLSDYGNHHDLQVTDHQTMLACGSHGYTLNASSLDLLYEIDLETGETARVLDYKTILQRTRKYGILSSDSDWLHVNAVVEHDGDLIMSSNFQSLIMRHSWDGTIKWMLSDPSGYLEMYSEYLLTPIGEDFEWPYNQHAIQVLPDQDQNPDTVDIMLFDNGTSRNSVNHQLTPEPTPEPAPYSRLVQYRVNEKNRTVEQIWQYGKDRPELYAPYRSDANLLSGGTILGTFDIEESPSHVHTVYQEVDREGNTIWQCLAQSGRANNSYAGYRCERMEIYNQSANDLHLGEEAQNLIPAEILKQYGYEASAPVKSPDPAPAVSSSSRDEPAGESIWAVSVTKAQRSAGLHTVKSVPQYNGDPVEVSHDNTPPSGMEYLLLELTVTKEGAGKEPFSWDKVSVAAGGNTYRRLENDSFLSEHGYTRMPGTSIPFGQNSGWICLEVPAGTDLNSAVLTYEDGDGSLSVALGEIL